MRHCLNKKMTDEMQNMALCFARSGITATLSLKLHQYVDVGGFEQ